jgi:hypothetical protein
MDNEIRDFFRQTAPKPTDATSFTLELNARLAAVEQIKAFRDREIRRARRHALVVFFAGLLLGGAAAAFLILHPVPVSETAWSEFLSAITGLTDGSPLSSILLVVIILLATLLPTLLISRKSKRMFPTIF